MVIYVYKLCIAFGGYFIKDKVLRGGTQFSMGNSLRPPVFPHTSISGLFIIILNQMVQTSFKAHVNNS